MEVWPFIPQRDFTESLEWFTEVMRCKGAEQRLALRPQARQGHMFEYLLDEQQLARAKSLARFCSAQEVLVPGWESMTRLGAVPFGTSVLTFDTTFSPYREGGQVIVLQADDHYEVRTVDALAEDGITLSAPLGRSYGLAFVMPLRPSRFAQDFDATRGTNPLTRAQGRFVTTDVYSLEGLGLAPDYPVYMGYDVLTDRTVLISSVRERYVRESTEFDNQLGVLWADAEYKYPIQTSQLSWSIDDRQRLWAIRAWLDERRGKWRGFWMPSWNLDFILTAPTLVTDDTMTVRNTDYRLYEGVRDIMILTTSGNTYFRRVISAAPGILGTEVLTLSAPIGVALDPAQVQAICLLTFTRLDADRVEIRHRAAKGADIMIPVMEAPIP